MTLGNMRRNGVRGLDVTCSACGYHTEVNVDRWPDDMPMPSFGPAYAVHEVRQAWRYGHSELGRATGQRARWPQLSANQAGEASRKANPP